MFTKIILTVVLAISFSSAAFAAKPAPKSAARKAAIAAKKAHQKVLLVAPTGYELVSSETYKCAGPEFWKCPDSEISAVASCYCTKTVKVN